MGVKDHDNFFDGMRETTQVPKVPNTVSRSPQTGDRSFHTVVFQSGKAVLDSEFQLQQDSRQEAADVLGRWQTPSGWLRGQTRYDVYCDYLFTAPPGLVDDTPDGGGSSAGGSSGGSSGGSVGSGDAGIDPDGTAINCLILPRLEAKVAGMPVVVENTYTRTPGYNIFILHAPQIYDGTDGTVKRTDFLFLEVWKALVAPSPRAAAVVQVVSASDLVAGDRINIGGLNLTASMAPAANSFVIVAGDNAATATNISDAINDPANIFATRIVARVVTDVVTIQSVVAGAGTVGPPSTGNFITLAVTVTVPGALAISGPTLTGGADRPNKPPTGQDRLYIHGNVMSPYAASLEDELVDPVVDVETTQRIQVQYRIRYTGTPEAINYKKHPDGFSNLISGPPPTAAVFAQGARATVASDVSGRFYPFVPADRTKVWGNSSAVAYDIEDCGLWIAGDGSKQAAEDLGTMDGFVYAIPFGFVHRHNNVSDSLAGFKGFDPISNANGAPRYDHVGYNGPLGPIAAGKSDRPDEHFCNVISQDNLLDLRRHITYPGVDLAGTLQHQIQSLLDGATRTWSVDTTSKQDLGGDSGDVSTQFLVCNEIGRTMAKGGAPPISGDTQRGVLIRNFDHISRRFGDQPVIERVVFAFWPGDRPSGPVVAPGTVNLGKYVFKAGPPAASDSWYEDDVLHLDLENLNATTLGNLFQGGDGGPGSGIGVGDPTVSGFAPPGTVITDVLSIYYDDGHYTTPVDQNVAVKVITGLGTQHVTISLDANDLLVNGGQPTTGPNPEHHMVGRISGGAPLPDGSVRRIFVEFEITYPLGMGTTDTPDFEVEPDPTVYIGDGKGPGPIIETDVNQRPNDFEGLMPPRYRGGYREVHLEYTGNDTISYAHGAANPGSPVGSINPEQIVSRNQTELYFPRRVFGATSGPMAHQTHVVDQTPFSPAVAVDDALTEFGSSSRKVVLASALTGAGQTLCAIEYFPQDPIPNYGVIGGGYQVAAYFRTRAPQTAGVKEGDVGSSGDGVIPTTLHVEPLLVGPNLWTGQVGMGSVDLAFPYGSPLEQLPVKCDPISPVHEWYFCATASITIDDFNADVGLLALHPFVQADGTEVLELGGPANDEKPAVDIEFRAYYPFADDSTYRPTIMSQPLFGATRHKVFAPLLVRATEDVPGVAGGLLFRKDELLLVVLSRFAELDDDNTVRFTDPKSDNRTCAGVYRTRNMLLVVGGKTC